MHATLTAFDPKVKNSKLALNAPNFLGGLWHCTESEFKAAKRKVMRPFCKEVEIISDVSFSVTDKNGYASFVFRA